MNQPPEWPLPADGLRPMPSPYRSVVSSASPEFDAPQPRSEQAVPQQTDRDQAGNGTGATVTQNPAAPVSGATREEPTEAERPAPVVGTAPVPPAFLATAPPPASGSVPPAPGSYQPPDGRLLPVEPLPVDPHLAEPLSPVPLSPVPLSGPVLPSPRRALPPTRPPGLPRAISGPPARAVSGPPARIAAPTGANFASDRPRTLVPATIVTPAPAPPRRLKAMIGFVGILLSTLILSVTGYFWALPVYDQTHATVIAPDVLIGLPKLTDSAAYARFAVATKELHTLGVASPLTVGYLASDDPTHLVVFVGGPHAVWFRVGHDLDRLLAGLAKNPETAVPTPRATDPGGLGGVARCGAAGGRTQLAVCGWQDHGTIALLFFGNRTPEEAAVLMRAMRPAFEHRAD